MNKHDKRRIFHVVKGVLGKPNFKNEHMKQWLYEGNDALYTVFLLRKPRPAIVVYRGNHNLIKAEGVGIIDFLADLVNTKTYGSVFQKRPCAESFYEAYLTIMEEEM